MSVDIVGMITCPRCGQYKAADSRDSHICVDCAKAENSRYSYIRTHQEGWLEAAEEAGISPWLKQPSETEWEYTIWCAYRDAYPGKKPSYNDVARQLDTTYNVVKKAAQRWSFQARMQAWMVECDRITMLQRQEEILDMNKDHIDMAKRLRDKMSQAIDLVDPSMLKPGEIASLMKVSSELERKARLDVVTHEDVQRELVRGGDVENPNLKKSPTQQNDLGEVLQILIAAGALGQNVQVGVRETTTTTREIVAKGDDVVYEE